jgi:putative oxidoreductase
MDSVAFYLVARALVASVFIILGLERVLVAVGVLAGTGTPVGAGYLAFGAFELAAGLLIAFGWQARWVALVMAVFLVVDAVLSHPFWRFGGAEQHGQLLHFAKNLAAIGGLLLVAWAERARGLGQR